MVTTMITGYEDQHSNSPWIHQYTQQVINRLHSTLMVLGTVSSTLSQKQSWRLFSFKWKPSWAALYGEYLFFLLCPHDHAIHAKTWSLPYTLTSATILTRPGLTGPRDNTVLVMDSGLCTLT